MDNNFVQKINAIAETVDTVLMDQMGLVPPEQYDVVKRDGRIYMVATFDPMLIGRHLKAYESADTLRVIGKTLGGMDVVFTHKTGFRFVILTSGKLNLPNTMDFPDFTGNDAFRLGVCLKGEVAPKASRLGNVIIGANQGAGKSNVEKLIAYQARQAGWKLYLCDPDGHTFNPDIWDRIAAAPVAGSSSELEAILDRLYGEIADRAAMFRQIADGGIPPVDIDAYNALLGGKTPPLQRIGLFVDEANSFMGEKAIFNKLADLLRRGRKWGLHIVLAGHEWHKDVVPAAVNDMLQTRIGLTTANEETANVVLRSRRWGKWVMGKPAGRGVIRIDQYQPMQFYFVTDEMEREWLSGVTQPVSPIPENEAKLVRRAIDEIEGRMSIPLLMEWGMDEWAARSLLTNYERRGWVLKDAKKGNARCVTAKLAGLVSSPQTAQAASNHHIQSQTILKPPQTLDMGFAGIG